jgi:hypothetical protein
MNQMPESFRCESDRQCSDEVRRLIQKAESCLTQTARDWTLSFDDSGTEKSEMFDGAAKIAAKLGNHDAQYITRVKFEPYPTKCDGAWRIHVEFCNHRLYYSGAEWYVDEDQLWDAWNEVFK